MRVISEKHSCGSRCILCSTSRIGHIARRTRSSSRFTRWISWMVSWPGCWRTRSSSSSRRSPNCSRIGKASSTTASISEYARKLASCASQLRPRRPDALPDRVPHVAGGLLEGEHRLVPDEDADLLGVELAVAQLQLADDDEQARLELPVRLVGLHPRPLRDVEHVLDGQRVEVVLLREGADRPPRSPMPSTLIQRTVDHSGRCAAMKAGRSWTSWCSTCSGE